MSTKQQVNQASSENNPPWSHNGVKQLLNLTAKVLGNYEPQTYYFQVQISLLIFASCSLLIFED